MYSKNIEPDQRNPTPLREEDFIKSNYDVTPPEKMLETAYNLLEQPPGVLYLVVSQIKDSNGRKSFFYTSQIELLNQMLFDVAENPDLEPLGTYVIQKLF